MCRGRDKITDWSAIGRRPSGLSGTRKPILVPPSHSDLHHGMNTGGDKPQVLPADQHVGGRHERGQLTKGRSAPEIVLTAAKCGQSEGKDVWMCGKIEVRESQADTWHRDETAGRVTLMVIGL